MAATQPLARPADADRVAPPVDAQPASARRYHPWLAHLPAFAIGLAWFILACWIAIAEHDTYNTTSRDIGVYLQVLWNTGHGRPFQTTLLESNRIHLAEHVAPLLAFLAPLYALAPDPRWLFVLQQAALALSGIPVYLLARRLIGGVWLPSLLVAGFYATPTLCEVAFDGFYPIVLAALPIAFAAYFVLTERWRAGLACALVALPIEEEAALAVVGLGVFLLLRSVSRRCGLLLLAVGIVWIGTIALLVMPRFHDPSTLPSGADNRTLGHFDQLRHDPGRAVGTLVVERIPLAARWLLAPTGGVALLAPEVLLIDAPHAATLLMADKEGRYRRHWAAPMLPVIWLAAVVGLARLRGRAVRALGVGLLITGSVGSYLADSSLPGGRDFEPEDVVWSERAEQLNHLVAAVPPGASLGASRRVLNHLADRAELYVFPPSYMGKLWPPERRLDAYLLDLTNDQTHEVLAGRQSPLRADRPYAIWLAGPDAMLLTDRPPAPPRPFARDVGGIALQGYAVRRDGPMLDLTLHWQAQGPPLAPAVRVAQIVDGAGVVLDQQRGTALDSLFPTDQWPSGQIVVDRVRLSLSPGASHLVVGWDVRDRGVEPIALPLEDTGL